MSRERYAELVQDLCDELGLGSPAEFLEKGLLQVGDALVGLEYLEDRNEIRLMADLGEIEEGVDRDRLFQVLLEANLHNTTFSLPTFSLQPESGHPIVAYHLPLQALVDEHIDLAGVLIEQLIPMLEKWKLSWPDLCDSVEPDIGSVPFPGSLV
jgi:hypothetical protein